MTTSALILIVAIIVLGGTIAALGDRLGTKVGKARLRIFNLRPRQTAMLVTIVTGLVIAASTLGILFSLSENLRKGIFEIDQIRKERREAQRGLSEVTEQKKEIEEELSIARREKEAIEEYLVQLNENFQKANIELELVRQQVTSLEQEVESLATEREELIELRTQLNQQITASQETIANQAAQIENQTQDLAQRQRTIEQLAQQQQALQTTIKERDQKIIILDQAITRKNTRLENQQQQLTELEEQISFLNREVNILEQYYQDYQELRESQIAIVRGQVLAFNVVQILDPKAVTEAINFLLRQANETAIKAANLDNIQKYQRIVQITESQVKQLAREIDDGEEYVVRILAAENYAAGEEQIRVFTDVTPNKQVFFPEQEIASVSLDMEEMSEAQIQARLDWLLAASEFRARRAGILGDIQIEDGKLKTIVNFVEAITEAKEPPDEIIALVSETAYTSGPLKLQLIALVDGKIMIST